MHLEKKEGNSLLKDIYFRFYAELNDFLPAEKKQKQFIHPLKTPVKVGEAIEALGIPLSEVDLVLVNSEPADRMQRLYENDRVSVFPVFETLDISELKGGNAPALRETRFILDAHLGKLAKYLRMLGFDTLYSNDMDDPEIIDISLKDNRIILTRDKQMLESKKITHGYYVRSVDKHRQLREVVRKFDLYTQFRSFTRCMTCNSELVARKKKEIRELVPKVITEMHDEFFFCPSCGKVFWKGSHFSKMESYIRDLA